MNGHVRKITLTALLIALTTICLKVIAVYPMPPFVRISLGPALVIFSSLYLGPFYGAIVGAGSDALGALIFPTGAYQPLFTVVYAVLGVLPWLLNFAFKKLNNKKIAGISAFFLLICWTIAVILTVWFYPQINDMTAKIVYSSVGGALALGMIVGTYFLSKHFDKKHSDCDNKFYRYVLISLISEITLMVFANSAVKAFTFEQPFMLMVEWMALISFINVPINAFGSYYLELLLSKLN